MMASLKQSIKIQKIQTSNIYNYFKHVCTQTHYGRQSSAAVNSIGLPQGSVFGPIGYTIYTLPISDIAKSYNVSYHTYADDTQLYLTFDPKESNDLETSLRTLSACVMDIKAWMCRNKLKLNEGKTEFLVVPRSPQNLRNLNNVCLNLGTTQIFPSTLMKNLGVYFDSSMSMSYQIDNICKSVRFQLKNVSQITKYITRDACNHAVRSHVISRLDYCNGLLTEIPSVQLRRLQSLENWAARIIFKVDRRHDPIPLLKALHWLPVKERIMFKILLLVYKSFHDQAPIYIYIIVLSCINHLDQIFALALTCFVFAVPELALKQEIVPSL